MMTALSFPTPLVLGHRGASAHAPENTLAAFRLALEQGADGIELDARLTRDGEVVVLHDGRVERVSNGQGPVADLTLAEVRRLDAGSRFGPAFAGERIPALAEVFETLGDRPVYDLEIKNFDAPRNGLERKVLALVRRYGLEKRVLISSFNPNSVRFFRRELPEAPAGLLLLGGAAGRLEETLFTAWTGGNLLGLFHAGLTSAFIARHKPRSVFVWGVHTPTDVRRAVGLGAVGVIADDPAMARRAL
jgi:glycerophosphoryl diester phosphodiesterase